MKMIAKKMEKKITFTLSFEHELKKESEIFVNKQKDIFLLLPYLYNNIWSIFSWDFLSNITINVIETHS